MIDQIRLSTISLMKKFILIFIHHIRNYLSQIGLQFSNKNMAKTFLFQIKNLLDLFKDLLPGLRQFLATESPLRMMKNAFYFISRTLFVFSIFKFLSWIFGYAGNGLIRNLGLISKCMTSSTEKQIITIHILPNISRSKDNQSREFGQLIEYNMRKVFLEKSKTK